jgi:TRAP-type mannitol/chloroaromatic compound transport system substrate-binding protein
MIRKSLLLASGAAIAISVMPAAAQQTWTMTTTWPSSIALIEIDRKFVEYANLLAGDELRIEFHDGGTLVPGFEVFDAVSSGTIEAAADWPGYWAGRDPAFNPLATHVSLFNAVDYVNWIQQWDGFDHYQEVYGRFGMVYLPYGVTNNESGFRTNTPIRSVEDLQGLRLRVSGIEQGRLLERLGGSQVSMAGGELYQAAERGVIDGFEFSTPDVDWAAGFHEVTRYWATPGWHQSASLFGVMINRNAWDALSEETQQKLRIAADATMLWSLSNTERAATEAYRSFRDAGVEITRYDDETLERIQELGNEVIVEVACENPSSARVYLSQIEYLADYSDWRDASSPFNLGRTPALPDLERIRECAG